MIVIKSYMLLMLKLVCIMRVRGSSVQCIKDIGQNISNFAVLPGFGWDNLRNVEMSRIVQFNYSTCQLTNDGMHLLPNGIDTIPLKQSKLDQFSKLFNSFTDFTSVTAKSVNQDAGFNFAGMRISGSFSESFLSSKAIQVREKSKVVRSELRFVKYRAKLQPDATLSPAFKVALLSIARHVLYNRTEMARYESEALVRDFGTHVITSVDAGAALVQEDHLNAAYASNETTKRDILLGAAMSLSETTGIGLNTAANLGLMVIYKDNRLNSYIKTYGGPMLLTAKDANASHSWTRNLDNNLVAVDRGGEPIYNFVNIQTLPIIPSTILYDVTAYIQNAVKNYYIYNTYQGCTDVNNPSFNIVSNIEDGSCNSTLDVVYFGGVFQMCEVVSKDAGDLCSHLKQANPRTAGYSCPTNFQSKMIHSAHFSKTSSKRVCSKCYGFFNCCDDEPIHSSANLKSFWCATVEPVDKQYYFSGIYSSVVDNIFTQAKTCPEDSFSRLIGDDINICLNEVKSDTAVNFGGIFSCIFGNPLASVPNKRNPKSCPTGFSPRLAGVIQDCAIHYCIPLGQLPSGAVPTVRRPPFSPKIKLYPNEDDYDVVYDPEKQEWLTELESRELKEKNAFVSLTSGEAAAIAIFVTILFIIMLSLMIYFYRRRTKNTNYNTDRNTRTGNTNAGNEDAV